MSKYTATQMRDWLQRVFEMAIKYDAGNGIHHKNMANAIDVLLREHEAATGSWQAIIEQCMLTEVVTPDENDPAGTISRVIDWHIANERAHVAEAARDARVPEITDQAMAVACIPSKYWDRVREAIALAAAPKPETEK